jgi:UDP-N-acetylglucosamine 3-dehydrogenase
VVGTGQFGKNHVRILNELGSLGGITDKNVSISRLLGELYRIPWYERTDDIETAKFAGAIVATPTITHFEVSKEIISKGISHVFVEKPFTSTVEEAEALMDLAKDNGVMLMVGFIERFNQAIQMAGRFQSENRIGKPLIYHAVRIRRWPERPVDLGVVKDTCIHDIDLVNFLKGSLPTLVYAKVGNAMHRSFEDHAIVVLSYLSGERAVLEANWLTPYKVRKFTITGIEGVVEADLISQEVSVKSQDGTFLPFVEWKEPLKAELQYFLDCIKNNSSCSPGVKDAINALKVADAIMKSSAAEQTVELD